MLSDFHFLRPLWLCAVIPALAFAFMLYFYRREQSPWHHLIAPHLHNALLGGQRLLRKQPLALPLVLICWLVTALALAGPSWQKLPQPAFALKKATVLVLDMSMSMRATDMAPDRLTQMQFAALDFVAQASEGEIALLTFAGDTFIITPLTADPNNIRLLISDLAPEIMPVQGSNMLAALQQADQLLKQAGYPKGDVIVMTDGFDDNSYRDIQDVINNWPHRLSIVGFGTVEGAPVKLKNSTLLKSATGAVVIPKLPQAQLAVLAKSSGGIYVQATTNDDSAEQLLQLPPLIALDEADKQRQIQGDQWHDNAIYLVWLLLPLVLLNQKYSSLLTISVLMLLPHPANAVEWRDLWQTKDQQAQQDYREGDFSAAAEKFTDPLWQGNAAYRKGDYVSAERDFKRALELNPSVDALHNLGNSLAQQQRYKEALDAYQQAQQLDNTFAPAKQNAELMQQLLQQQQEQQQQNKQQGENQQSEGDEQQSDSESQSEKDAGSENEANNSSEQQPSEQDQTSAETAESKQNTEQQTAEEQAANESDKNIDETAPDEHLKAVHEAWPNASVEEQQQLDSLLRKVQDDPALLLRSKMYQEYLKRQQQRLPKGVDEQW
ncbi:VWA domain-containing protein [Rheinheimera baltica]|uniref:VWA domain-containing protein n=1 Tax=Rheinheimera baltica TaxID=67576 RepID=UPI00273D361C|nr:VWA domain-containing protein [Rheinheimera baltica]MDP5141578.1 VWA domain-containing protein [Rheinheimera baltica]